MEKKDSICKLIKLTNKIFETNINSNLKEVNLTDSQIRILLYLFYGYKNNIEFNQIDIQKRFKLSNPTVSGILDRLALKEFIKRVSVGRSNKIVLTEKGIGIIKSEQDRLFVLEDKIIDVLSNNEKEQLRVILKKIINNNEIGDVKK